MFLEMLPLTLAGIGLVVFAYSISIAKSVAAGLIEYQYENHHQIWISDGRPPGDGESKPGGWVLEPLKHAGWRLAILEVVPRNPKLGYRRN